MENSPEPQKWNWEVAYKKWFFLRFFLLLIALVLCITLAYLTFHKEPAYEVTSTTTSPKGPEAKITDTSIPTDVNNWKTLTNEKFGYTYKYPEVKGGPYGKFSIDWSENEVDVSQSLKTFAQGIWNANKNPQPNLNISITISPLLKTKVGGVDAYTFQLNGGFEYASGGGYVLDEENTYYIVENKNGAKLTIHYPSDDPISAKIIGTFKIDGNLIPDKVAPDQWMKVNNNEKGFSYQYPANIFSLPKEPYTQDWYVNGKRGSFLVRILEHAFDPNNIQGMYGKIDNAKKVTIGGTTYYQYGWGDAGCGAAIYEASLNSQETIQVNFGSCQEDLYLVSADFALQNQILSTFQFSK